MDASIATLILNASALGILGYHLLVGLPTMLKEIARMQQTMMEFFARQAEVDRMEFSKRAQMIADQLARLTAEREGTL